MKLCAFRSNAPDPRLARWLMALLIAVLAFLSQRSVLSFGLTGADTPLLLAAASWSDRAVPPALVGPALGDPSLGIVFYRPLTALSYSLHLHTTGLDPLAFQLGNLLLHVGVVVLLFFVGRAWLSLFGAFFAAVVFALHPLLVEVVPDVSRR